MPRRRKTMSGAPAQAIKSVPGQRYGEGVQQAQMQQQMPAPNTRNEMPQVSISQSGMAAAAGDMPPMETVQPLNDPAVALRSLPTGLMNRPDNRPVTSGLAFGPGSGPEVMGTPVTARRPSTRMLQMLYDMTNDPMYLRLLERYSS